LLLHGLMISTAGLILFVERYIVQRTFKNLFGVYSCFKADKVSIDMMTNLSLLK